MIFVMRERAGGERFGAAPSALFALVVTRGADFRGRNRSDWVGFGARRALVGDLLGGIFGLIWLDSGRWGRIDRRRWHGCRDSDPSECGKLIEGMGMGFGTRGGKGKAKFLGWIKFSESSVGE
jgi:hypothetical protein